MPWINNHIWWKDLPSYFPSTSSFPPSFLASFLSFSMIQEGALKFKGSLSAVTCCAVDIAELVTSYRRSNEYAGWYWSEVLPFNDPASKKASYNECLLCWTHYPVNQKTVPNFYTVSMILSSFTSSCLWEGHATCYLICLTACQLLPYTPRKVLSTVWLHLLSDLLHNWSKSWIATRNTIFRSFWGQCGVLFTAFSFFLLYLTSTA